MRPPILCPMRPIYFGASAEGRAKDCHIAHSDAHCAKWAPYTTYRVYYGMPIFVCRKRLVLPQYMGGCS